MFGGGMNQAAKETTKKRQDAAKAISAGFDAHVAKPVQPGTLGIAVARLIASGREALRASQPEA